MCDQEEQSIKAAPAAAAVAEEIDWSSGNAAAWAADAELNDVADCEEAVNDEEIENNHFDEEMLIKESANLTDTYSSNTAEAMAADHGRCDGSDTAAGGRNEPSGNDLVVQLNDVDHVKEQPEDSNEFQKHGNILTNDQLIDFQHHFDTNNLYDDGNFAAPQAYMDPYDQVTEQRIDEEVSKLVSNALNAVNLKDDPMMDPSDYPSHSPEQQVEESTNGGSKEESYEIEHLQQNKENKNERDERPTIIGEELINFDDNTEVKPTIIEQQAAPVAGTTDVAAAPQPKLEAVAGPKPGERKEMKKDLVQSKAKQNGYGSAAREIPKSRPKVTPSVKEPKVQQTQATHKVNKTPAKETTKSLPLRTPNSLPLQKKPAGLSVTQARVTSTGRSSGRTTPSSTAAARSAQPTPSTPSPLTPKTSTKYQHVKSKVNSITDHKPTGGNVTIFSQKRTFNVTSKIGSLDNATRTPENRASAGGNITIESHKLDFKASAKPRVDAKNDYTPTAPAKKMLTRKLEWNVQSKIGSLDNVKHKPTGGNVKIQTTKLEWKADSKVGSKDNIEHKPGGGNIQVFSEKPKVDSVKSKIGSLDNAAHVPGGGNVNINEYRIAAPKGSTPGRTSRTSTRNSTDTSRQSSLTRKQKTPPKLPGEKYPLTTNQALGIS